MRIITNHTSPHHGDIVRDLIRSAKRRLLICTPFMNSFGLEYICGFDLDWWDYDKYFLSGLLECAEIPQMYVLSNLSAKTVNSGDLDIRRLLQIADTYRHLDDDFQLRVFSRGLHAKLYVADGDRALVTSANLTEGGLLRNHEVGILLEGEAEVTPIIDEFFLLWQQAHSISFDQLERLKELVIELEAVKQRFSEPVIPTMETFRVESTISEYIDQLRISHYRTKDSNQTRLVLIEDDEYRQQAEEIVNWLIAIQASGTLGHWRQEAAQRYGIQRSADADPFDIEEFKSCYRIQFYSFARQKWLNLISIPWFAKKFRGRLHFYIQFTSPWQQEDYEKQLVIEYPDEILAHLESRAEFKSAQYPAIDLARPNGVERAKGILEHVLRSY